MAAAALARTWRLEIEGDEHVSALRAARIPVVFAVWHGQMLAPLWDRRHEGITLLISQHRDGGYLACAGARWGYRVVRGSSTRGGVTGLRSIIRALRGGTDAAFAADGPRGPSGVAKPGAVAAARLSGAAVVPVGVAARRTWRLRSWDQMQVPALGTRVRIVYGERLAPNELRGTAGTEVLSLALDDASRRARW